MATAIISQFKETPKTKIGWWAFGLSAVTICGGPILGIFAAVIRPMLDKTTSETTGQILGFAFGIIILLIFIAALTTSIMAFRKGERSWAVWVALILSIIETCFWIFMIAGEFLFPH